MTNSNHPSHMITRFAPSPTGLLHLGHAWSAHLAHQMAKENNGTFLIRFEDIDHTRVRPEFYQSALDDLAYLEIYSDLTPIKQLDRLPYYQKALQQLQDLGVVYPCTCTRKQIQAELQNLSNAPHGPEGPLYPGTCRDKTRSPSHKTEPSWRLDTKKASKVTGPLTFSDKIYGTIEVNPHLLGDIILARKDIATSYHLAVTVDDAHQKITHITRGNDLLPSTHVHRLLQTLLQLPQPKYLHHPLVLDNHGKRLAKRHDSLSIKALIQSRKSPQDILNLASKNLSNP